MNGASMNPNWKIGMTVAVMKNDKLLGWEKVTKVLARCFHTSDGYSWTMEGRTRGSYHNLRVEPWTEQHNQLAKRQKMLQQIASFDWESQPSSTLEAVHGMIGRFTDPVVLKHTIERLQGELAEIEGL